MRMMAGYMAAGGTASGSRPRNLAGGNLYQQPSISPVQGADRASPAGRLRIEVAKGSKAAWGCLGFPP